MGLTVSSTGAGAADAGLNIQKLSAADRVVALAGNPNVGKSTVFNALTGLNQHTGNWPGKTVTNAQGRCMEGKRPYILVDIPGTYSLMAHSAEEEVARNFICFGGADGVCVVCDATCLERNMNLVLQTLEITPHTVVCVNLMDEAKRKNIRLDLPLISKRLGVPVVGAAARKKKTLSPLLDALDEVTGSGESPAPFCVRYPDVIEEAAGKILPRALMAAGNKISPRWLSLRLLDADAALEKKMREYLGDGVLDDPELTAAVAQGKKVLQDAGIGPDGLKDMIVTALVDAAAELCRGAVSQGRSDSRDRALDKIFTSPLTGYPVMLLMLALVFWLTIVGANYPSQWLASGLFWVQDRLMDFMAYISAPAWLCGALVMGVYRVLAWVVSVAAPAGLVIWLMANVTVGGQSVLGVCAEFLDPFARLMGLDGVILMAFILGFPANEIVLPIIIMVYTAQGSILDMSGLGAMKELFVQNGWTWVTAVNVMLFSLMHWPCSTTLITIKKETGSAKWTALAAALPTVMGVISCAAFTSLVTIIGKM